MADEYINKADVLYIMKSNDFMKAHKTCSNLPTIDIVHCMHCKYHYENGWCRNPRWENFDFMVCTPDMFFCADGKRRKKSNG